MAAHAYSNTTTADLWQALESVAHKPVTGIAASFTEQEGVPLIRAETSCSGDDQRLALRQDRFVIAPPAGRRGLATTQLAGPGRGRAARAASARCRVASGLDRNRGGLMRRTNQGQSRRHRLLPGRIRTDQPGGIGEIAAADVGGGPRQFPQRQLGDGRGRPRRAAVLSCVGRARSPPTIVVRSGTRSSRYSARSTVWRATAPSAR